MGISTMFVDHHFWEVETASHIRDSKESEFEYNSFLQQDISIHFGAIYAIIA